MSTIVTRAGKGSPLTHTEVDNNFTNLNTDKLQSGDVVPSLVITSADINGGSIDGTPVGANSASTGAFTTLTSNSTTTLNGTSIPASKTLVVTDGSYADPSWITSLDDGKVLPSMSGNSGKFLTTDGSNSSWSAVSASPSSVSDQENTSTGYFDLPAGTTAQRPASPTAGALRFNTTIRATEIYTGTDWEVVGDQSTTYSADFLVVGGGGGGGRATTGSIRSGGGGGAGGFRTSAGISGGGAAAESALTLIRGTSYTITVGAGGAGGISGSSRSVSGSSSVFSTITSTGGGGGGDSSVVGLSGGSGGGGGSDTSVTTAGSGTSGQGYAGGAGTGVSPFRGGGGGGASAAGGTGASVPFGGNGVATTISGSSVTYAGGGGGGGNSAGIAGNGGSGGGGAGGSSGAGTTGTTNTGGGGGGAYGGTNSNGGNGASGIVVVRVPTISYSGITTGSPTVTTSGSNTILTYTSSGTYTA